jgi:phosphatidylserine/phosphatidylglycerophosphate/cardiolipin synthase-like enzyme
MILEVLQKCASGGMFVAEFLTTNGTSDRLEQIIKESRKELVLVSPFVQISPRLIDILKAADKRRVKITLIYGKVKLESKEKEWLDALPNLSLRFKETLHAKCYYNEKQLIITSMNLYDFSEKTNYEMGVLVQKEEDKAIYDQAVEEVEVIQRSSEEIKKSAVLAAMGKAFMGVVNVLADDVSGTPKKGFCIRCAQAIDYDTDRPLCPEHFAKWNVYKKPEYPEKHCHRCGRSNKVCKDRPLCLACYKKQ